jgi:hypothetical protein
MKARLPTIRRKPQSAEPSVSELTEHEPPQTAKASRGPRQRRWFWSRDRGAADAARERELILQPYARKQRAGAAMALLAVTAILCFAEGYGFSLFAPYRMVPFFFPIGLLGAITIWALPELGTAPTKALERVFFIAYLTFPLWPNYLAIALPGLPWITLVRLTCFPLLFLLLLSVSISQTFRKEAAEPLLGSSLLWKGVAGFSLYMTLSVALSNQPQTSLNKLVVSLISWTAIYFAAAYIFNKPGRMERWTLLLWLMALGLSLESFWEHRLQRLPWAGHIPSFLAVADDSVGRALSVKMRAGTDMYRDQAMFSSPLGLSEFLALSTPFVLHYVAGAYKLIVRIGAAISLPLILTAIIWTDSRLGFIGFLLANVFYIFFWGALQWRRQRGSLWGPAVVLSYPAFLVAFGVAILTVPRLRVMTLGGAKTAPSTEARKEQVREGLPMVFKHPFGHGIGRGADALGYVNPAGTLTIDTYFLLIALDYGIFGFLLFYGTFVVAIGEGFRAAVRGPTDRETTLLIPLTISLISFFVIKTIYSGIENQSIVFMMLGAVTALVYRVKRDHGVLKGKRRPAAKPA